MAFVIERLGKYNRTLDAGFHILIPFFDRVAYKRSLKEEALDVAQQTCITKDNVSIDVDGILYLQVIDAKKSAYGIEDYKYAVAQLAQTTMRSVFGTFDLDGTFEARDTINTKVVHAVDEASVNLSNEFTRRDIPYECLCKFGVIIIDIGKYCLSIGAEIYVIRERLVFTIFKLLHNFASRNINE